MGKAAKQDREGERLAPSAGAWSLSPGAMLGAIAVEGIATSSVPSEPGTAVFSGTCTVDAGDGTPPLPGVPFTVAVATNAERTGSLALTLGGTNLPAAAVNEGSMTIR